ncbi:MAG: ABC transporter ATP-binding protein [Anaerolineales bacterium]
MGFFSSLATEAYDRQYGDVELIRRIATYFRPYLGRLIVAGIALIVLSLSGAVAPILVARGVDLVSDNLTIANISLICGAVLATGLVTWGANWLRRRLISRAVGDVVMTLRTDAFQASAQHDLSFYDEFSSGRIVSRITSDTQEFAQVVVLVTELVSQIAQTIFLGIFLVYTEWRLALLLFSFLPVVFAAALSFRKMARKVTRRGMRAMGNVNAAIKETVSGIAVAKNFRQERGIYDEFDESNQQSYKVNIKRGFVLSLIFPVLNAINSIGTAILVWVGGLNVAQGVVTAGAWYLFLLSLDRFWFPILNLSAFWAQIQSGLSSAERVFALIDAEPAVVQKAGQKPSRLEGDIQFKDIWFRYTEQEQVLCNFNLHIRAGENVALVGHTGSGKSSLARLIARFYEFQKGQLLLDQNDIRTFDLPTYRRQLGIVSQLPFLFSGAVVENIRYACPEATGADIERLAYRIGGGEWLETLPDGLHTQVGERGGRLSMGQRQLVALLRVLVQDPAIFILDEATASIDPFTEWQIQQALNMILANTTSILIAHRLSTVKAADRIIVLKKGNIIEEGDHTSLMTQAGHYADLYNTYFRHQSLDYRPPGLDDMLREKQSIQIQIGLE